MTNLKEGAIIVSLIDALNRRGSFCGETHVQKGAYFLRELTGVPLQSPFTLYLYGPYSFRLHELLNQLWAEELVQLEPRAMGASWRPGERNHLLKETSPPLSRACSHKSTSSPTEWPSSAWSTSSRWQPRST